MIPGLLSCTPVPQTNGQPPHQPRLHRFPLRACTQAVFESVLAPGAISDQPFFTVQGTLGEITINGFDGGGHVCTVAPDGTSKTIAIAKVGWDAG